MMDIIYAQQRAQKLLDLAEAWNITLPDNIPIYPYEIQTYNDLVKFKR